MIPEDLDEKIELSKSLVNLLMFSKLNMHVHKAYQVEFAGSNRLQP